MFSDKIKGGNDGIIRFWKKEMGQEKSDQNKALMKALFSKTVDDSDSYQVVYGFSLDIARTNYLVMSKTTYQYASLIIGYRSSDMSIVLLQTTPELEGCSEPQYFKRDEIKKAKITMGEYTIYHQGGMMAGYTQFSVAAENDENFLVYCHQDEEATQFHNFWKEYCKKN